MGFIRRWVSQISYSVVLGLGAVFNLVLTIGALVGQESLSRLFVIGAVIVAYMQLIVLFLKVKADQLVDKNTLRDEYISMMQQREQAVRQDVTAVEQRLYNKLESNESEQRATFAQNLQRQDQQLQGMVTHLRGDMQVLRGSINDAVGKTSELSSQIDQVKSEVPTLQKMIQQRHEEQSTALNHISEDFKHQVQALQTNIHDFKSALSKDGEAQKQTSERLFHLIDQERSQRIVSFARRDSPGKLPQNAFLLITVPRTGSTWLMDMLRCHPSIYLDPAALLFERLKLSGGRYPTGLSNGPDANLDFETAPGRGNKIPSFKIRLKEGSTPILPTYGLEKIHPLFFDRQVDTFLEQAAEVAQEENINMKFMYQVRDPRATISSFINYQKRDPRWLSHVTHAELPDFMMREYTALYEMVQHHPAPVLDYTELKNHTHEVLMKIYQNLWQDADQETLSQIAEISIQSTGREKRSEKLQTAFLGNHEGPIEGTAEDAEALFFEEYAEQVASIYEVYHELLASDERIQV